jgi:hypothetical protein
VSASRSAPTGATRTTGGTGAHGNAGDSAGAGAGAVWDFLRLVAARADLLEVLKTRDKDDVLVAAAGFGYPFTEAEFDTLVWDAEVRLAEARGEAFDGHFPLWQTMWGRYYLEYLVIDLVPSLEEIGLVSPRS